jgi:hypothetical protein
MNRKAVFFSISSILVILVILISFQSWTKIKSAEKGFAVDRAGLLVPDHFVRDFDRYYLEQILAAAAKPAIEKLARLHPYDPGSPYVPLSYRDIEDLMKDGVCVSCGITSANAMDRAYTTDDNLRQALATFNFPLDRAELSYTLVGITQPSYDTFVLDFTADYIFSIGENTWQRQGKSIQIPVSVYSLPHPGYNLTEIDTDWTEQSDADKCLIQQLFDDPSVVCAIPVNIMPHGS